MSGASELTLSVVICCHTEDRWDLLPVSIAVDLVAETRPVHELIRRHRSQSGLWKVACTTTTRR